MPPRRTSELVWVRDKRGRLVRVEDTSTETVMDPPTNNAELRGLVEQQGEKISQLTSAVEFLVRQLTGINQPRSDPPPPPLPAEEEWFDDAGSPRVVTPREKTEKERQEFDEMKGKMEKLKKAVRKTQGPDSYFLELEGLYDGVKEVLPEGFKMPDIDKFDGTGNPKNYVLMCMGAFQSRGLSPALMAVLFQQTLKGAALVWYFTLDTYKAKNWEGVVKAFIAQYEYNQELDVTIMWTNHLFCSAFKVCRSTSPMIYLIILLILSNL